MRCPKCGAEFGAGLDLCPTCGLPLERSANDAAGEGNRNRMGATGPTIVGGIVGYAIFQVMVPSPPYVLTPGEQSSRVITAAFAGAIGVAAAHAVVWVWRKLS